MPSLSLIAWTTTGALLDRHALGNTRVLIYDFAGFAESWITPDFWRLSVLPGNLRPSGSWVSISPDCHLDAIITGIYLHTCFPLQLLFPYYLVFPANLIHFCVLSTLCPTPLSRAAAALAPVPHFFSRRSPQPQHIPLPVSHHWAEEWRECNFQWGDDEEGPAVLCFQWVRDLSGDAVAWWKFKLCTIICFKSEIF